MNHTHERTLGIVYNDNILSFEELLKKIILIAYVSVFLECPKSDHGKNAKFTFFVIKGAFLVYVKFPKETCLAV